jgi:hypothetical protein
MKYWAPQLTAEHSTTNRTSSMEFISAVQLFSMSRPSLRRCYSPKFQKSSILIHVISIDLLLPLQAGFSPRAFYKRLLPSSGLLYRRRSRRTDERVLAIPTRCFRIENVVLRHSQGGRVERAPVGGRRSFTPIIRIYSLFEHLSPPPYSGHSGAAFLRKIRMRPQLHQFFTTADL